MRRLLFFAFVACGLACEPSGDSSGGGGGQHIISRQQLRYYSECLGRIDPIEKAVGVFNQSERVIPSASKAKHAAMEKLVTAVAAAKKEMAVLNAAGGNNWEQHKATVEPALAAAEAAFAEVKSIPK